MSAGEPQTPLCKNGVMRNQTLVVVPPLETEELLRKHQLSLLSPLLGSAGPLCDERRVWQWAPTWRSVPGACGGMAVSHIEGWPRAAGGALPGGGFGIWSWEPLARGESLNRLGCYLPCWARGWPLLDLAPGDGNMTVSCLPDLSLPTRAGSLGRRTLPSQYEVSSHGWPRCLINSKGLLTRHSHVCPCPCV